MDPPQGLPISTIQLNKLNNSLGWSAVQTETQRFWSRASLSGQSSRSADRVAESQFDHVENRGAAGNRSAERMI